MSQMRNINERGRKCGRGGGGTFGSTSKLPVNTGCQLKMEGKTKERKKDVSMAGVVITGG